MSKVRFGYRGSGWWAITNHVPLLARRKNGELVAVCSLDVDALSQIQNHLALPVLCILLALLSSVTKRKGEHVCYLAQLITLSTSQQFGWKKIFA